MKTLTDVTVDDFARRYIDRYNDSIAPSTISPRFDKVILHGTGSGIRVQVSDGSTAIIADSDMGVSALGYRHPKLMEFRARNAHLLDFVGTPCRHHVMRNVDAGWKTYEEISQPMLADRLIRLAFPGEDAGDHMVIFDLGGGTLVAKTVRYLLHVAPHRTHFLTFRKGFHGRFVPELTDSNPAQKKSAHHSGIHSHVLPYPLSSQDVADALEGLEYLPLDEVNAVFLEGIQGDGGINAPHQPSLTLLIEQIRSRIPHVQIVWDEIQTGLGRTGKMFSFEHYGSRPDVVLIGKSLAGGLPLSAAVVPRREIPLSWHGGTFPGYPFATAQAVVVLDIFEEEDVLTRASVAGEHLTAEITSMLAALRCDEPELDDAGPYLRRKGYGLMQGIEFRTSRGEGHHVWRDAAWDAMTRMKVFTTAAGLPRLNPTIRLMPSLLVSHDDIDVIVDRTKVAISDSLQQLNRVL